MKRSGIYVDFVEQDENGDIFAWGKGYFMGHRFELGFFAVEYEDEDGGTFTCMTSTNDGKYDVNVTFLGSRENLLELEGHVDWIEITGEEAYTGEVA